MSAWWICVFFYLLAASGVYFFFFQAEDGIRDVAVTGVQTCALPISELIDEIAPLTIGQATPGGSPFVISEVLLVHDCGPDRSDLTLEALSTQHSFEIGRASCRERV